MPKGEKKYIIRAFYPDGTYAGTLTQDHFKGFPEFTMEINGGFSEIRMVGTFTFLQWWLEPDGLQLASTLSTPFEGSTGPFIATFASGEYEVFNATFIGNLCQLCVIENGEETQIWSGIYSGLKVSFSSDHSEVFENFFTPNYSRLSSRIFRDGDLTKFSLNADPADMIKQILNNADIGLNYTDSSIEEFGEEFTYTFNAKTAKESIDAVLSLLTRDWYYYIGGDDIFYLGQIDTLATTHHIPINALGNYSVEKNLSLLRNRLLFLGENNIYKQYDADNSQDLYGVWEERMSNTGVTVSTDADAIAARFLSQNAIIQTAFTIEVLDDNFTDGGYDIESIKPGDQVIVNTDYGDLGFNYWGQFLWAEAYWKFDVYSIGGIPATVRRITYRFDRVILECAFNYQNISEILNKTDQEVKDIQFLDAPVEPTIDA